MQKDENPNKNNQTRKSVLIFSAVTALFIGIMGYEVIRENSPKETIKSSEKKFSIVLNTNKDFYQKPNVPELKLLNAQNQHYSNKIIALKEEAHESAKRLHQLQLSILSAEQVKESKQIQKLRQVLEDEENQKNSLTENLTKLQKNIETHEAQIANMESTIEVLDEIVQTQKNHKAEFNNQFKTQFEALQNENSIEKERLLKLIQDLNENQTALNNQIKTHASEVEKLEEELSRTSLMALDKELELDYLAEDLKTKHTTLTDQAKALSFVIEAEQLASKHLQKELHYLESQLAVELEKLKITENELQTAHLENAEKHQNLEIQNQEIAKKDETISLTQNTLDNLMVQSEIALASLNESLKENQARSVEKSVHHFHQLYIHEELAQILLDDLQKKQAELEKFKNVHHALSHDRNALKSLIDEKTQEISYHLMNTEERTSKYEATILELQENIEKLTLSLDKELEKATELEKEIAIRDSILLEKQQSNSEFNELTGLLTLREHELNEIKEVTSLKQQSNEELSELLQHHEEKYSHLQTKLEELNNLLKNREDELTAKNEAQANEIEQAQQAYQAALLKVEAAEASLIEKEKTLNESKETNEAKLEELKLLLKAREDELTAKDEALIQTKEVSEALAEEIQKAQEFYQTTLKLVAEAENSLNEKEKNVNDLTELLFRREQELKEIQEIALAKNESHEKLNTELTDFEAKLEELKQLLRNNEEQLSAKDEALNTTKETNNSLANEIQKAQESYQIVLKELEDAKSTAAVKENDVNQLTELLLQKDRELKEIQEIALAKNESNEKLNTELIDHEAKIEEFKQLLQAREEHAQESYQATLLKVETAEAALKEKENHVNELTNLLLQKDQELKEIQEIALAKNESNEQLNTKLIDHEAKLANLELVNNENISMNDKIKGELQLYQDALEKAVSAQETEKANAQDLITKLEELDSKLKSKESELSAKDSALNGSKETNEALALEIQKTQESYLQTLQKVQEAEASLKEKENDVNQLTDLLLHRERELENANQVALLKHESHEKLNAALADQESKIAALEAAYSTTTSSNDKIREELEAYQHALEKAIILQDIEKKSASDLSSKIEELDKALKTQEDMLSSKDEALKGSGQTNEGLIQEIQKTQESYKTVLKQYEDAQENTLKNQENVNFLTELLLHRERELAEINDMILNTTKTNEKLAEDLQKQHENLENSLKNYKDAEDRALEAERTLLKISEELKRQERELLETKDNSSAVDLKNQELAKEIHQQQEKFETALKEHIKAQENTHENEKNLHAMIEILVRRENELLKRLKAEELRKTTSKSTKAQTPASQAEEEREEKLEEEFWEPNEAEDMENIN